MAEQTRGEKATPGMKEEVEDKNPYRAVPRSGKEAAILKDGEDTRDIIQTPDDNESFLGRIGQLRMTFNVNGKDEYFNGTASVFAIDNDSNLVYAVTCAHNLKYHDELSDESVEATSVIFERRKTITKGRSESIKEYKVSERWVHSGYNSAKAVSPNDLAVIAFKDDDEYFRKNEHRMGGLGLKSSLEKEDLIHIFGYPVDKRGELWGDSKQVSVFRENDRTNLVQYNLPTTGGQSGSPIIRVKENTEITGISMRTAVLLSVFIVMIVICNRLGLQSSSSFDIAILTSIATFIGTIYVENSLNQSIFSQENVIKFFTKTSKTCTIVGVHTTGNNSGNYGVKLTKDSLGWIEQIVNDSREQNKETDSFYCLKETPFL